MKKTVLIFTLSLILTTTLMFSCGGGGGGGVDNAMKELFTISYNANGAESGIVPAPQNGDKDSPQSVQANVGGLAKSGYLFDGWNTSADGSGTNYAPGSSYKGTDVTMYAKWAAIFNVEVINPGSPAPALDGAQRVPGVSFLKILSLTTKGRSLANIDIPEAIDGYPVVSIGNGAFQDCSDITDFSIPETVTSIEDNAFAGCTGITTLTIPRSVTAIGNGTFSGCGGLSSLILLNPVPPTMGTDAMEGCTATISVPAAGVDAYKAAEGWDTYSTNIAGYSTEPHVVTFEGQGATTPADPASKTVTPPAVTIGQLPTAPIKTGYNFGGWFTEPEGAGTEFTASTVVSSNITVYAKWDEYSYTVRFNDQEATTPASPTSKTVATPNTTIDSLPTAPAKDGFYFSGWNTKADGTGTVFNASTPVTGDITVYAIWINNPTRTVTFNSHGADIRDADPPSKQVISPAVTVGELPTPPAKRGHNFHGWFRNRECTGEEFTASTVVTEDITVYAKWVPFYTITYSGNGNTSGAAPQKQAGEYGNIITLRSNTYNLQKTGYIFSGWNTVADGSGTTYSENTNYTITNSNITLYAKWVAIDYTITYDGNGNSSGSTPSNQIGSYNNSITLQTNTNNLAKTGYTFSGWNTKADGSGSTYAAGGSYTIKGNITFYAKWVPSLPYSSIKFDRNGASIGDIVFANRMTVSSEDYGNNYSSYNSLYGEPVGIVAYKGGTSVSTGYHPIETLSAGIAGKIYILGINEGENLQWAPQDTTGYITHFNTSTTDGSNNWTIIKAEDPSGSADASVNYPAFYYANTYSVDSYTSGWYLPSFAEIIAIFDNRIDIIKSIARIKNDGFVQSYMLGGAYYSSTQAYWEIDNKYVFGIEGYSEDPYSWVLSRKDGEKSVLVVHALDD